MIEILTKHDKCIGIDFCYALPGSHFIQRHQRTSFYSSECVGAVASVVVQELNSLGNYLEAKIAVCQVKYQGIEMSTLVYRRILFFFFAKGCSMKCFLHMTSVSV